MLFGCVVGRSADWIIAVSRSRKKSPFIGYTTALSDQPWKAKASRAFRHAADLEARADPDEQALPTKRWARVHPWDAPKDGKQRVASGAAKRYGGEILGWDGPNGTDVGRDAITRDWLGRFSAESYEARMAQMSISIPDKLKGWAESRVAEGRYSSTSDYVRDLVRRDQEHDEKLRALQSAIDEGLASPVVDTTIEEIIARGKARHGIK